MTSIENSQLGQVIQESAAEVLETMFFTSVLEESETAAAEAAILASLTFRGTPSGTFQIEIAESAARSLAADFLGVDPDEICGDRAQEVTCELANMLCGSILSRIEPDSLFDLSHPDPANRLADGSAVSRDLFLPAGNLKVSLRLEDAP